MGEELVIRDLKESTLNGWREVSAEVDGDRIFFRAPLEHNLEARGESFIGIGLLEAMARNVDIKIDDAIPISAKLHRILPRLQDIYACWNSDLHRVKVGCRFDSTDNRYERVTSYYSGGVDGSYTLCRNMDDITHLVMLSGFEIVNDRDSWLRAVEQQTGFARSIGKELIPIETNARWWIAQRKIHWWFAHGLVLSSMGPLLRSKRIYIGSTHTYKELFPWGSHPLTDPMWSTESTEVIHDGCALRRSEKLRVICGNQKILDNLKVCWRSIHQNCGECEKCIRTMTALCLLGASSRGIPKLDNLDKIKKLRASEESSLTYLEDALILAKMARNSKAQRILQRQYSRYQIREALSILDEYMLGGIFHRIYRSCRKPHDSKMRVALRGSQRQI